MSKELKPIPHFETEAEERHFWETHSSVDYVDWSKARRARFPNLKFSSPEELAKAAGTEDEAAAD